MSVTETSEPSGAERMAGITDAQWWFWFNEEISGSYDTWNDWLAGLRFPHEGPLQSWLENDIEDTIKAADALRLTTAPTTKTFTKQWSTFRQHHEELDQRGKYSRRRYMTWRAAALKAICDRNRFQDDSDAQQARHVLHQTLLWFWPTLDVNGNYPGGNFWCVRDQDHPDPMAEYAGVVLLLMCRALKSSPP